MRKCILLIASLMLVTVGFSQTGPANSKTIGGEKGARGDRACSDVYYEFDASACHSYVWNGVTYTESGDYVQTFPIGGEYVESFFYDFDNTPENYIGWQRMDLDGDGNQWGVYTGSGLGHNSDDFLASYSYLVADDAALSPDNIIILPLVTARSDSKLSFWVREATDSFEDVLAVYAVTSLNYTSLNDFVQLGGDITVSSSTWTQYTFDLGAFDGMSIGIAFRHYNCYDEHGVFVDDVEVYRTNRASAVTFNDNVANGVIGERSQLEVAESERSQEIFTASGFGDVNMSSVSTRDICDSIVTMHLTILGGPTYEFDATACHSYTWNGVVYTESGDYTQLFDVVSGEGVGGEEVLCYYDFDHSPTSYSGWQLFDVDGDGNDWGIYTGAAYGHNSEDFLASFSYVDQVDISPDNIIVLPYVNISHNTKLSFWAREIAPGWPDVFGVFVTTATEITSTADFEQIGSDITVNGETWIQYTYDLSAYAGQTVGIAFRHYNCTAGYAVLIDDIEIYNGSSRAVALGHDSNTENIVRGVRSQQVALDQQLQSRHIPYVPGHANIEKSPMREICDSLVTLHLTITGGPTYEFSETACDSYTWNDETYYESGDYVQTFNVDIDNNTGDEVIYHYSFDDASEDFSEWQILSADDDDYNWDIYSVDGLGHNSSGFLGSFSYDSSTDTDLTPDNIVVLPYTAISSNTRLCFWARQLTHGWPDILGVYVTTATEITSTADLEQLGSDLIVYDSTYRRYSFNLGAYAGQTLAVVFRHYNCTGAHAVFVDDIVLYNGSSRGNTGNYNNLSDVVRDERNRQLVATNVLPQGEHIAYAFGHANIAKVPVREICDSTVTLHLTINFSETQDYTVTECDTYTWHGEPYTESGTYVFDTVTAQGCTRTETLYLTINNSETEDFTVAECDTYTWHGEPYTESGTYVYNTTTAQGCARVETLYLTINNSETEEFTLTECDTYTWHGEPYTESGTYVFNTTTAQGCERVETLYLTINNSETEDFTVTECDTYTWHGEPYTESGTYVFNTTTAQGCERVETLYLTINNSETQDFTVTECDTYTWHGEPYTESGTYVFDTVTALGCTRTETLYLTINNSETEDFTVTECDTYTWHGEPYTESGTYVFNTTTAQGCERVETLYLTINNSETEDFTVTECDTYTWHGEPYTESGTYVFNTTTAQGCERVETLYLTINNSETEDFTVTECDTYTWHGQPYTESGTYVFNTTTAQGCTRTETLYLTINNSETEEYTVLDCDTYSWHGTIYDESGTYVFDTTTAQGCPRTETLYLTIGDSEAESYTVIECDTYTWHGEPYTESGTYVFNTTTAQGCARVETLYLTINNSETEDFTVTECDTYTWHGEPYTESGTYVFNTTTAQGCERVETLYLTINNSETEDFTVTECDTYTWHGEPYTESGTYVFNTTTAQGCERVETLYLTINNSETEDFTVTECDTYTWHGEPYTESGTYVFNTTTAQGCERVETLYLTINNSETEDFTVTECDTYTWHGEPYTESGTYVFNTTTAQGCERVETLYLTINNSETEDFAVTECDTYTWHGQPYTESGTYTYTTTTAQGCEHIETLYLTINNSETEDFTVTECDTYIWHGEPYTESGTYTYTTTTTQGCERVETLYLTINETLEADYFVTVCDNELPFVWHGTEYYTMGDYPVVIEGATEQGCDSIVTLKLSISEAPVVEVTGDTLITFGEENTLTASGADTYVWNTGATTSSITVSPTAQATTYTVVGTNADGCSSTAEITVYTIDGVGANSFSISVYPNPTRNIVRVEAEGIRNIRLVDMLGQTLYDSNESGDSVQVDMSGYAVGVYFMEVKTVNGIATQKVVRK